MHRTNQVVIWSDMDPYYNYIPQDQPAPQEGIEIDPWFNAVTIMAPATSREYSHPQTIFKFTVVVAWITEPAKDSQKLLSVICKLKLCKIGFGRVPTLMD